MDCYAVIGNPVAHSQSPFIHAAFASQTGEAMEYGRLLCPLDGFEAAVRAFAAGGGRGCNVTVPFKFEAWELAASHTPHAALAGACNALRFDARAEGWLGDNTDGVGLLRDIERNAKVALVGRRVLLLGSGGAAAGVLGPLISAGPAEVVIANRTAAKASALVQHQLTRIAPEERGGVVVRSAPIDDCGEAFDVVVNATSTSLLDAAVPVAPTVLGPGCLAIDLMYGPAAAGFMRWAERRGAIARDGLGMLVEQAAVAFELFRGVAPDTAPVLSALRRRMEASPA